MNSKPQSQQGFSLLEILIAFSILALSLGILLNIFSSGLRHSIVSEEYQQALIIAESKLASVGIEEELQEGEDQGTVQEKYFWRVKIVPFDLEEQELTADKITVSPYQVNVTVEWNAGKNNRQIELTTLRLAKKK